MTGEQSSLDAALRQFEAVEANLAKLERVWEQIEAKTPSGILFGGDPEHEDLCRSYLEILKHLPAIDGWRLSAVPMDLQQIAQARLDAQDVGEIDIAVSVEEQIVAPAKDQREYRFRLDRKRRELIRSAVIELMDLVDTDLWALKTVLEGKIHELSQNVTGLHWESLRDHVDQIETLLGSMPKPDRWQDLRRHLAFGLFQDLSDIIRLDWPRVKATLTRSLYQPNDPIPVDVADLAEITASKPRGRVATKLKWEALSSEDFERLIYALLSNQVGYENPEWLTHTNAPDRGRDLSATRTQVDPLSGTIRSRVIIQCRHLTKSSVSATDVSALKDQMSLWQPPRVDVMIIATSGRFSSDAVDFIERHNVSDRALRIEMWPDSHLELLLAHRPDLIAEFGLR